MDEPRGGPSGAVATADGGAGPLSITHKGLSLVLTLDEVLFLKTILAVVRPRLESSPSWTADNVSVVKAGHLLVSALRLTPSMP